MPTRFTNIVINPNVSASLRKFGSGMVGFSRIALGPPLQELFEQWNLLRIVASCIVKFVFFIFMLSAKYMRIRFPMNFSVGSLRTAKTEVGFFVVALTSLYCYYGDRSKLGETGEKGHRSTWRLIYFEAFTLMSLSLSTQAHPGFKLDSSNFLLICLVLGIIKKNFMVGVGVTVLCYMVMSSRPRPDSRQEQRRRDGGEPDDIVVDGDSLLQEAPQLLYSLPLTIHSSPSLSTLMCRPVNLGSSSLLRSSLELVNLDSPCPEPCRNLEWWVFMNTLSPILPRQISLKTLNYVSLSATEYSNLLSSERNLTRALRRLKFVNRWSPVSRASTPSIALRLPRLMGPADEL